MNNKSLQKGSLMGTAITFLILGITTIMKALYATPILVAPLIAGVVLAICGIIVILLRESGYVKEPVSRYVNQGLTAALPFVIEYLDTGEVPEFFEMVDVLGKELAVALHDYFAAKKEVVE